MPISQAHARIFAVVLAAGAATRFGATKQLADYQGASLARRAARLADSACSGQSVLVLGHEWQAVYAACKPIPGGFVLNTDYSRGIGTSIAAGVAAVRHVADAVLVILADQPLISTEHLQALQSAWSGNQRDIVASTYAATTGVPALFPAGCFERLCALDGDNGAQTLLSDSGYELQTIAFEDAALDIDIPADLLRSGNIARN